VYSEGDGTISIVNPFSQRKVTTLETPDGQIMPCMSVFTIKGEAEPTPTPTATATATTGDDTQ
jgi:hypothetical protein